VACFEGNVSRLHERIYRMTIDPQAQKILNIIEAVDPEDMDKLDELDALVEYFRSGKYFIGIHGKEYVRYGDLATGTYEGMCTFRSYSRSRDALKAIRPENCTPRGDNCEQQIGEFCYGWQYCLVLLPETLVGEKVKERRFTGTGATEELAELHAIIQAIAHERGQK
jgi:hypothetical protein